MNFTLLITVLVTALTLVVAAYIVAKLIGPRSYAKVRVSRMRAVFPPEAARGCPCRWDSISSPSCSSCLMWKRCFCIHGQ